MTDDNTQPPDDHLAAFLMHVAHEYDSLEPGSPERMQFVVDELETLLAAIRMMLTDDEYREFEARLRRLFEDTGWLDDTQPGDEP